MNKAFNKIIKSQVKLTILSVVAVILVTFGTTYALFSTTHRNTTNQTISIGEINAGVTGGTPITLADIYPIEESEIGESIPAYTFTITNPNAPNNYAVNYELFLGDYTSEIMSTSPYNTYTQITSADYNHLMVKFDDNASVSLASLYNQSSDKYILKTGYLGLGDSESHTLKFWLSTTAPNSMQGKVISLKVGMSATATPTLKIMCETVAGSGNYVACDANNMYVGERIKIGNDANAQYFRYIRTTDTTSNFNECQQGADGESSACSDTANNGTVGIPGDGYIRMIAEYNLNICDLNNEYSYCLPNAQVGLQHENVRGWVDDTESEACNYYEEEDLEEEGSCLGYGQMAYSGTNSAYNTSNVKTYVEQYASTLSSTYGISGLSGSAMTYAEIQSLCNPIEDNICAETYPWVYNTSYWSGSADEGDGVWSVSSDGNVYGSGYNNVDNLGVRAVLQIPAALI